MDFCHLNRGVVTGGGEGREESHGARYGDGKLGLPALPLPSHCVPTDATGDEEERCVLQ